MDIRSNIEASKDDPEIRRIDLIEETLGDIPREVMKIRELITGFEASHFKYQRHPEYIRESISNLSAHNDLAGIGSVTDYHCHVVSDKNLPPAMEYPAASVPMDMTSVQGYILNGRVHAHMTLADENSMVGGHLESGTRALTFFIITIGVLPDDLELSNLDNYRF